MALVFGLGDDFSLLVDPVFLSSPPQPPTRPLLVMANSKRKADVPRGDGSESDGSDVDLINVDFDFTSPDEIDYHALKRLLIQLLHTLAPRVDIDSLADQVILNGAQNAVGTVIKVVDDVDNDPFAIITPLVLAPDSEGGSAASTAPTGSSGKNTLVSQDLRKVILERAPAPHPIRDLLSAPPGSRAPPILLLHERLINLPPQVAAPLYRLLHGELEEQYTQRTIQKPSHYLVLSRVFPNSALPDEDEPMEVDDEPSKRRRTTNLSARNGKRSTATSATHLADDDMGMFHPEDSIIGRVRAFSHFLFPSLRLLVPSPVSSRLVSSSPILLHTWIARSSVPGQLADFPAALLSVCHLLFQLPLSHTTGRGSRIQHTAFWSRGSCPLEQLARGDQGDGRNVCCLECALSGVGISIFHRLLIHSDPPPRPHPIRYFSS